MHPMSCRSVRVMSTLDRVCRVLDAWYFDKNSSFTDEDEARALLGYIESVFVRYFDSHMRLKPLVLDECGVPITDDYSRDWTEFLVELRDFVWHVGDFDTVDWMRSRRFNVMCPVMYLAMRFTDMATKIVDDTRCIFSVTLVIDGLQIRPCAIGWNFLETVFLRINSAIGEFDGYVRYMSGNPRRAVELKVGLRIQVAGVCAAFAYSMLKGSNLPVEYFDPDAVHLNEWDLDQDGRRLLNDALSRVPTDQPTAAQLNDYEVMSGSVRAKRDAVIENMVHWRDAHLLEITQDKYVFVKDSSIPLQDRGHTAVYKMGIDKLNLYICKNGVCVPYHGISPWS